MRACESLVGLPDVRVLAVEESTGSCSPQTNSVAEHFLGSLKYDHLYREDIRDGVQLVDEVAAYLHLLHHAPAA